MDKQQADHIDALSRTSSHHTQATPVPGELTPEEKETEKKLVRKLDWRLMIWA